MSILKETETPEESVYCVVIPLGHLKHHPLIDPVSGRELSEEEIDDVEYNIRDAVSLLGQYGFLSYEGRLPFEQVTDLKFYGVSS